MSGKFIVFEGTDGAGKSAMIEATRKHLDSKGVDALFVQDPGGTEIGSAIRKILLNPQYSQMTPMTELLLYSASRNQLVTEYIIPALRDGRHVISDRFIYSTLAYQGASGQIPQETLDAITAAGAASLCPERIFFLDLPAKIGLSRISGSKDRIEKKGLAYMETVRSCYQQALAKLPEGRLVTIDATKPLHIVKEMVVEYIDELFF